MFEITKNDKDTFDLYLDDRRAYPGSEYDFTFENKYIIYHVNLKHNTIYFAADKENDVSTKVFDKRRKPYSEDNYSLLIPHIINAIKLSGDNRYSDIFAQNPMMVIDLIFRDVLPHYGYAIREEQIKLSKKMYIGLTKKKVAICEAEVGTGKSLAYLVAALCAKRYEQTIYGYSSPITITTSTIELQTALVQREIPNLSRMLIEYHIIDQPLKAVVRKGKEHYFCLLRFYDYINKISRQPESYKKLLEYFETTSFDKKAFDLDGIKIASYIKAKICIKGRCYSCVYADICKYHNFVRGVMSSRSAIDFQVANHNLYLNSTRQEYLLRYMGDGTPVTLRKLNDQYIEPCPYENKRIQFTNELSEELKVISNEIEEVSKATEELIENKRTFNKADKEKILNTLHKVQRLFNGNLSYIYSQFNKQMDKTVTEAKAEVEGHIKARIDDMASRGIDLTSKQDTLPEISAADDTGGEDEDMGMNMGGM